MLLIAPQPFYSVRGTPMNVLQMCRVLCGAGHEVDLATYPLGEEVAVEGLRVLRAPGVPGIRSVPIGFSWRKVALDTLLALRVWWLLATRRYDLVHAVEESVFLALPWTWLGVRVVYDLDSLISDQLAYSGAVRSPLLLRGVRVLERLALRRSVAAITVCRALSEAAEALAPGRPVFQVEDAPLPEAVRPPDPEAAQRLRLELGVEQRPVVLYTGNLEAYQGIDLLLEAAAELRRERPDALLVLVGGEVVQVERLRRRLVDAGLVDAVRLVGPRPPAEMADWMALASVLVSPRIEGENTPLKLYGYMASGRPIVATSLPPHTQILDEGCAFLCEATPEAVARALVRALSEPEEARRRGGEAALRARRDYGPEAFRDKLLAAYDAVLGGAPLRARSASM